MLTVNIVVSGWVHKSHERQMFNFVTFKVSLNLHQQPEIRTILQIQIEIVKGTIDLRTTDISLSNG